MDKEQYLPYGRHTVNEDDIEAVIEVLDVAAENLNKTDTSQWSPKI